jgi:hypothetical protein
MAEFLSSYGLWILLAGIFVAMHMFGMGCCGGHGHPKGSRRKDEAGDESRRVATVSPGASPAEPVGTNRVGSCH